MAKTDAIVIGAGIIGAPIAYELAKQGRHVTVIDKNQEAGAGSTSRSCAIVRFYYSTYQSVALAYEGVFFWLDWENYLLGANKDNLAKFIQCGSVLLKTKGHNHEHVLEHFRKAQVKHEDWDLPMLKKKFAACTHEAYWPPSRPGETHWKEGSSGQIEGAIYTAEGGYVNDPMLATVNVMAAAQAQGADFVNGKEVVQIRRDANRVLGVTLDDGQSLDAPIVVNAAGPHSFLINRLAGVENGMNIKTKALRHEVHFVPSPPGVDFEHEGFQVSDADNGIYFRPGSNNTILVGSEDPECDPPEWINDPDHFDPDITDSQWTAHVSRLTRRVAHLNIPDEKTGFAALYDVSDDWIPIYDKSDLQGFYMAIGTSGNQFKVGPLAGYVMAELIDRCENGHDHDSDPVVVTGPYTKLRLNMGHYSRRRQINPNSSFSVRG